jgi:hypothetical protein
MKQKKTYLSIILLLGFALSIQAQQATTAAGGTASGIGGTVTYSVGQVVYTTITGSSGSAAQGVQQPYELYVVSGIENSLINLELTAYPNPTTRFLILKVDGVDVSMFNFELYDGIGKIIESRKIRSTDESIDMDTLPSATYYLKVSKNNNPIKTFKIIKN